MTLSPITRIDTDVAVVGSGFGGSLTALGLLKRGKRVALVERGRHPRFAIGESSTPLANLLIEELADRYDLPGIRAFSKWGTWQRARPEVACGLKRGFTFFFHQPGAAIADDGARERQLMVAASPHDEIADTHWYRPEFDQALMMEARAAGAEYLDMTRLERLRHEGGATVLEGEREGRSISITARFVIDATGPRGFLHHALGLEELGLRWLPATQGLYSHFELVDRWDRLRPARDTPPYPVDDAALHHVFPGGWIWILRFNNGLTSAGAALTSAAAAAIRAADGGAAWDRLLATLPSVADQFRGSRAVLSFVHAPRLAFRSARVAGSSWALLPSAAGVIDPLLSTGFPLTLLGIVRLLDLLERTSPGPERDAALLDYERTTLAELDATEQLVGALYATMDNAVTVQALEPSLFRSGKLQRGGAPAEEPRPGAGISAQRAPVVRSGAGRVRGGGRGVAPGAGAPRSRSPDRSRDRTVRHRRLPRSRAARLVSGTCVGSPGVGCETARDTARDRRTPRTHRHDPGRDLTRRAAMTGTGSWPFST